MPSPHRQSQATRPARPARRNYSVPHMTGSLAYEVHGDTATGIAYWTETTLVDGKAVVAGSGHYEDELKKVAGHWKFAKRTVVRDVPAMTPEQMAHAPDMFGDQAARRYPIPTSVSRNRGRDGSGSIFWRSSLM
jgi:hypothetical protein